MDVLFLDKDEGELTIEQAAEIAETHRWAAIIVPTKSHNIEKNGVVCERFRIVMPLARPIGTKQELEAVFSHLTQIFGPLDPCPGYDPVIQAQGIMERFGPEGCPTFHGVASCVDYLCGYLAVWAGVTALHAREHRQDGKGDWAETSLSTAAALTQLLLLQSAEPESARGAFATGMNEGERVYELSDGWIFAQGKVDLTETLSSLDVAMALATLAEQGVPAVPVQTCKELADLHRANPTTTVDFEMRESDGWKNECFAPSWLAYDGERVASPGSPHRVGSDAPAILLELGYSTEEIEGLVANRVVGQTEFLPLG